MVVKEGEKKERKKKEKPLYMLLDLLVCLIAQYCQQTYIFLIGKRVMN